MKTTKNDLKVLLRPLIVEIVHDVLKELILEKQGYLSNIIKECQLSQNPQKDTNHPLSGNKRQLSEASGTKRQVDTAGNDDSDSEQVNYKRFVQETKNNNGKKPKILEEQRKRLLDAVGIGSMDGLDVFSGTTPLANEAKIQTPHGSVKSPLSGIAPDDPGIDVAALLGGNKKWNFSGKK